VSEELNRVLRTGLHERRHALKEDGHDGLVEVRPNRKRLEVRLGRGFRGGGLGVVDLRVGRRRRSGRCTENGSVVDGG
jgi:hypothetical protein